MKSFPSLAWKKKRYAYMPKYHIRPRVTTTRTENDTHRNAEKTRESRGAGKVCYREAEHIY